jgi:hypothetical protein
MRAILECRARGGSPPWKFACSEQGAPGVQIPLPGASWSAKGCDDSPPRGLDHHARWWGERTHNPKVAEFPRARARKITRRPRADAHDVPDGETVEVLGRDALVIFTSPRGSPTGSGRRRRACGLSPGFGHSLGGLAGPSLLRVAEHDPRRGRLRPIRGGRAAV